MCSEYIIYNSIIRKQMTWEKQTDKILNSYFTKEPTWIANKHPKLALHTLWNAKNKRQTTSSVARLCSSWDARTLAVGNADSIPALENHLQFLFTLNVDHYLSDDSTSYSWIYTQDKWKSTSKWKLEYECS